MTLHVFWSEDALKEVEGIFRFIALQDINNAHLVADRIDKTVGLLSVTPFGRAGRIKNTYEAVVPKTPFIIAYQLEKQNAWTILHVIHGARDWKAGAWPE